MAKAARARKKKPPPTVAEVTLVRALPGIGYGLRHPTMIVRVAVRPRDGVDWAAVDALIGERPIEQELPFAPALAARLVGWAAALQREAGLPVFERGRMLEVTESDGTASCLLAAPYVPKRSKAALHALGWAAERLGELLADSAPSKSDLAEARKQEVAALKRSAWPSTNMMHFLLAAHERGIPWQLMTANLYRVGSGKHARWLDSSFTDRTSVLGSNVALRKDWTAELLARLGFPVPQQGVVGSEAEAEKLARKIGFPVVVKPADKDGGVGVAANLDTLEKVRSAYAAALKFSPNVLLQKHAPGRDYRLTVVHGRVVWAILRQPGGVTGDGKHDVARLIEMLNAQRATIKQLLVDDEAHARLAESGLQLDSVPTKGQFVRLRSQANVTQGGTPIGVMDQVHPDNMRLAEQVTAALRLDIAGIDLLMEDIGKSWLETGANICEVNAKPQLGITTQQHLYGEILEEMLPGGGRIPVAVIVGAETGGAIAKQIQEQQLRAGARVGVATATGAWIGGKRMIADGAGLLAATELLLSSQQVDVALVVVSNESVLVTGLPLARYDLLVVAGGTAAEGKSWLGPVIRMLEPGNEGPTLIDWDREDCRAVAGTIKRGSLQRSSGGAEVLAATAFAFLQGNAGRPAGKAPAAG